MGQGDYATRRPRYRTIQSRGGRSEERRRSSGQRRTRCSNAGARQSICYLPLLPMPSPWCNGACVSGPPGDRKAGGKHPRPSRPRIVRTNENPRPPVDSCLTQLAKPRMCWDVPCSSDGETWPSNQPVANPPSTSILPEEQRPSLALLFTTLIPSILTSTSVSSHSVLSSTSLLAIVLSLAPSTPNPFASQFQSPRTPSPSSKLSHRKLFSKLRPAATPHPWLSARAVAHSQFHLIARQHYIAIMSDGQVQPPRNPVVAEAHEVDTFRKWEMVENLYPTHRVTDLMPTQTRPKRCLTVSSSPTPSPLSAH